MKSLSVTIQMKVTQQYLPTVGAVYYAVKDCYNLRVFGRNPRAYHFNSFNIGQFSLIPQIIIPFEEVINCKLRCR